MKAAGRPSFKRAIELIEHSCGGAAISARPLSGATSAYEGIITQRMRHNTDNKYYRRHR
jgi:hypothetical protein